MKRRKQMSTNKCEFGISNEESTLNRWYYLILHAMVFHYLAKQIFHLLPPFYIQ